ncbi:hypothetical protein P154DRAFT_576062 [Amniculicola lignicola CBS 123094]|uniref:Uncharacterized protein n=1 Tax=Amniculicola lignicola CBS 123094 TaxID=1392246 RepID=A0A6A5WMU0_9PLEO|nr:hypothetical protein P154DRAFT_576062 [Amniculicola lignicola CBS 123094]
MAPPIDLNEIQIFEGLKAQILSLATALYGAHSTGTLNVFPSTDWVDIQSISDKDKKNKLNQGWFCVCLIAYTSHPGTFTKWELLDKSCGCDSVNEAMYQLLHQLRAMMEFTLVTKSTKERLVVEHKQIPDVEFVEGLQKGMLGDIVCTIM